jgi:hypothetical protein
LDDVLISEEGEVPAGDGDGDHGVLCSEAGRAACCETEDVPSDLLREPLKVRKCRLHGFCTL